MGIKAKLRRDINSPGFSTCLLLIQLVWVAADLTSYHSLNRVDIKSHNRQNETLWSSIQRLRRSDHITDALISLHWLRVLERIVFKVAVQTYRALHGDASQYLRQFTAVADIPSRQRLRSSTSDDLCLPAVRLPTVGRRAFSVAGASVWNALPADVTSAPSLFTFRKRLKLHLFPLSYPGLVL